MTTKTADPSPVTPQASKAYAFAFISDVERKVRKRHPADPQEAYKALHALAATPWQGAERNDIQRMAHVIATRGVDPSALKPEQRRELNRLAKTNGNLPLLPKSF